MAGRLLPFGAILATSNFAWLLASWSARANIFCTVTATGVSCFCAAGFWPKYSSSVTVGVMPAPYSWYACRCRVTASVALATSGSIPLATRSASARRSAGFRPVALANCCSSMTAFCWSRSAGGT